MPQSSNTGSHHHTNPNSQNTGTSTASSLKSSVKRLFSPKHSNSHSNNHNTNQSSKNSNNTNSSSGSTVTPITPKMGTKAAMTVANSLGARQQSTVNSGMAPTSSNHSINPAIVNLPQISMNSNRVTCTAVTSSLHQHGAISLLSAASISGRLNCSIAP